MLLHWVLAELDVVVLRRAIFLTESIFAQMRILGQREGIEFLKKFHNRSGLWPQCVIASLHAPYSGAVLEPDETRHHSGGPRYEYGATDITV